MRAAGIRWCDYDRFMQQNVKQFGNERLRMPAFLKGQARLNKAATHPD